MRFLSIFLWMMTAFFYTIEAKLAVANTYPEQAESDTLQIKLQEAILLALERNPDMAIQRLEPAIAKSYADEERAAFDPSIGMRPNFNVFWVPGQIRLR